MLIYIEMHFCQVNRVKHILPLKALKSLYFDLFKAVCSIASPRGEIQIMYKNYS